VEFTEFDRFPVCFGCLP